MKLTTNKTALALCASTVALVGSIQGATYSAAVLADNPVAYWRLDSDGSDSSSFNRPAGSINGSNGTATFGTPSLVPAEPGNGSFTMTGTLGDQMRLQIPGFEKIGAGGFTAEYWVSVTQYPGACCDSLVSDGVSGGDFFMMNYLIGPGQGTNGAVRPHFGIPGTVSITTNATPLSLNQTYHVVTTWDANAGMGHVYFDGVSVLSSPVTATLPGPGTTGDNDIFIGRDGRENRPSNFIIDEVALYEYALRPAQVANHYNIGIAPEPSSAGLLGLACMGLLLRRRRS